MLVGIIIGIILLGTVVAVYAEHKTDDNFKWNELNWTDMDKN